MSAISKHLFTRKDLLETTICLSEIATLRNGYAFQSSKYNALGKWKILTITNVSGERHVNDEDCNCIINLAGRYRRLFGMNHSKERDIYNVPVRVMLGALVFVRMEYLFTTSQRSWFVTTCNSNVNQEFLYWILSVLKYLRIV